MIERPDLPYAKNALEPHISEKTIGFHYDKHHQGYVNNLNTLIKDRDYDTLSLEDIILKSFGQLDHQQEAIGIFNNAAQVWNHNFYWKSLSPTGGTISNGPLFDAIIRDFKDIDSFISQFKQMALTQFASGWAWLVFDKGEKKLSLKKTSNAFTPLTEKAIPLLTIDVWEHAYYLDYQNLRASYVDVFFNHLANWTFAEENYQNALRTSI